MLYTDNILTRKSLYLSMLFAMALCIGALLNPNGAMANKDKAQKDFNSFAEKWMANLENVSKQNRTKATAHQSGDTYYIEYVVYGPEWTYEIKETGEPSAPYIGLLKYQERLMTKGGVSATEAANGAETVSHQAPVTEIFRYSKGKWEY